MRPLPTFVWCVGVAVHYPFTSFHICVCTIVPVCDASLRTLANISFPFSSLFLKLIRRKNKSNRPKKDTWRHVKWRSAQDWNLPSQSYCFVFLLFAICAYMVLIRDIWTPIVLLMARSCDNYPLHRTAFGRSFAWSVGAARTRSYHQRTFHAAAASMMRCK